MHNNRSNSLHLYITVLMTGIMLLLSGCYDKGDDPVPPVGAGDGQVVVIPSANPDFDDVIKIEVMDRSNWNDAGEVLTIEKDWRWNSETREITVTRNLDYPVFLKISGRIDSGSSAGYYAMATCVQKNGTRIAANEVTSLICAHAFRENLSVNQAQAALTGLLQLENENPFDACLEKDRPWPVQNAMKRLKENFRADNISETDTLFENAYSLVIAGFTQDASYGVYPFNVTFTDISTGDTSSAAYAWDFGDGTQSDDRNPSHTYTKPEPFEGYPVVYDVSLSVNAPGMTAPSTSYSKIYVYDPDVPASRGAFDVSTAHGDIPLTVEFSDASSESPEKCVYKWNFGDGATASGANVSHTYTKPGEYTATLTVIGAFGKSVVSKKIFAGQFKAVTATAASDFSSGAHSVTDIYTKESVNNLKPTTSDITVVQHKGFFYRIERYRHDNVAKFDINRPDRIIWQYSTLDEGETNSNPHDLVFLRSDKAYLIRYGASKAWIVNPSAEKQDDFKIGELDLSDYGDQDGLPEMHNAVICGNRLFISLERMNRNAPSGVWQPNTAYVAVFDTLTDTEIETGQDTGVAEDGIRRKGIPLAVENPISMQYLTENGTVYVQGVGRYPMEGFPGKFSGGIEAIDPETFKTGLVLDDGDSEEHPWGNIAGMAIISPAKGYFVGYVDWGESSFYPFNPETGIVGEPLQSLINKNIAVLESGAILDPNGRLWVSNRTDGGISLIDPETDQETDFIRTGLPPLKTVFCNIRF